MSVCLTITFESLDVQEVHFAHPVYLEGMQVKFAYEGHRVKGQSHTSKKCQKSLFPQCKTSIGHNSASMKHRAVTFACSVGSSVMVDRMVWSPFLSR